MSQSSRRPHRQLPEWMTPAEVLLLTGVPLPDLDSLAERGLIETRSTRPTRGRTGVRILRTADLVRNGLIPPPPRLPVIRS
jgi:hypothetical protein